MLRWLRRPFRRARGGSARGSASTITPRSEAVAVAKVGLADLAPAPAAYLGCLGYLQLVFFENLGRAVMAAPTPAAKSELARATRELGDAHEVVLAELRRLGLDPAAAMEPYRVALDDYQRRTQGADWHEILITCYLTHGFLADFFAGLAAGLPRALAERIAPVVEVQQGEEILASLLAHEIDGNSRLASRLALWGRRLVGDTLLVARSVLAWPSGGTDEARIQPVFGELVGSHTRRMDALGLTA